MKNNRLITTLLTISIIVLTIPIVFAGPYYEEYCVEAAVSNISPSSVKIGDEFTVGILIDSCGSKAPTDIEFELHDISKYIGVKESLKKDIGNLGFSNSNRFIVYHMKVSNDALPGQYEFDYQLTHGKTNIQTSRGSFSITVTGEHAELGIASVKSNPTLPVLGDQVDLTLRVENIGKGTAKSVSVYADHPFTGTKQSFIGSLDPNEDGPAVFTFIASESGEFEFPVTIKMKDDFGESEIKTSVNAIVLAKDENKTTYIVGFIVFIILAGLLFYIYHMKKSKDAVIRQLMKGKQK